MRLLLILIALPLLTYASSEDNLDCSDHYGLTFCASAFELADDQVPYSEEEKNTFSAKTETPGLLFGTSQTDEDMNQIQKDNPFRNTDSFRAYMKTLEKPGSTNIDSEFSVKKRILDNTNFDLDCRLMTNTLSEISNGNYYDCALQRHF